jgi:hypothetical protein
LIREYFSEAITNGGLKGSFSDLSKLRQTLDYEARNLSSSLDTLTAGSGYSDDRVDRRIDRLTSSSPTLPLVGDKETDAIMMDVVSNILPWIVDRKKNEDLWFIDHQNGRSQAPGPNLWFSIRSIWRRIYCPGEIVSGIIILFHNTATR